MYYFIMTITGVTDMVNVHGYAIWTTDHGALKSQHCRHMIVVASQNFRMKGIITGYLWSVGSPRKRSRQDVITKFDIKFGKATLNVTTTAQDRLFCTIIYKLLSSNFLFMKHYGGWWVW